MKIQIGKIDGVGPMAVRLEAETFGEVTMCGRWLGHIEAAGHAAISVTVETAAADRSPRSAAVLILPIAKAPPDGGGRTAELQPAPGQTE